MRISVVIGSEYQIMFYLKIKKSVRISKRSAGHIRVSVKISAVRRKKAVENLAYEILFYLQV